MTARETLKQLKAMGTAQNRKVYARHGVGSTMYGVSNPKLQKKALAAAKQIGLVEVDHGETGCKTPDAATYIKKAVERKSKKATA